MKDFENTPNKVSIRKRVDKNGKVTHGYVHYDHMPKFYSHIRRFIEYNIGKDFNSTYSKFCNKIAPKFTGNESAIDVFLFEFRFSTYKHGKYVTNVTEFWKQRTYYYIDEDGKIAKHKREFVIKDKNKKEIRTNYGQRYEYNIESMDKNDWKRTLAEIQDSRRKEERERKKKTNVYKEHLLEWIEYKRKLNKQNPDV